MSNKVIAVSATIIVATVATLVFLTAETNANLQTINPVAVIASAVVVVAGLAWLKKTNR